MADSKAPGRAAGGGWVPVPDPTTLTIEAVDRAIGMFRRELQALRELHDKDLTALQERVDAAIAERTRALAALQELLGQRLDAMDERHHAQADVAVRIRLEINEEVRHLREIIDERFTSIQQQLTDRDLRITEAGTAADRALSAALNAARELVESRAAATADAAAKYEVQIAGQISQLAALAAASRDGLDAKIGALKERLDRGEGSSAGAADTRTERRLDIGTVIGVFAVIVSIAAILVLAFKK